MGGRQWLAVGRVTSVWAMWRARKWPHACAVLTASQLNDRGLPLSLSIALSDVKSGTGVCAHNSLAHGMDVSLDAWFLCAVQDVAQIADCDWSE